jgi:hypothetical protein
MCNVFVLVHTTPPSSRDFAAFRTRLLLDLSRIICQHGARLAYPTQVSRVVLCAHASYVAHAACGSHITKILVVLKANWLH